MDIVYIFDDNYVDITIVSILSLLENNKNIVLHIVDYDISEFNKQRLNKISKKYNTPIYFYPKIDLSIIPKDIDLKSWPIVTFARLFCHKILPKSLKKVIYIDCDTLILNELEEVYKINMEGMPIAGVLDCTPASKIKIGYTSNDKYYSNGILLIDLEYWRKNDVLTGFMEIMENKNINLPHLDQDVLNIYFKNKFKQLPLKYNVMPLSYKYGKNQSKLFAKSEEYYTVDEITESIDNPYLVHITGDIHFNRPWQTPCFYPLKNKWLNYIMLENNNFELTRARKADRKLLTMYKKIWIYCLKIPFLNRMCLNFDKKYIYKIYIRKGEYV